ncbi:MAG TPA: type IX secretion system outer membrane channel protein PorV, partial [Salinimicrobium sp.]|nr:type IX secretion system outer membrane channel protein PorV [Salinimicrobium sp.]
NINCTINSITMNFRTIFVSFCFCLLFANVFGQELVRPVITGTPFLRIVPDARSGGMGETGVATVPDPFSQFHNPAKYLFMKEGSQAIGLSYIPRFIGYADDIFLANAGYFNKFSEKAAVSASLTYFSFGHFEIEEQMGNEIISQGSFVPNEFAIDATYSLKLDESFGMSVTGRYIRSDITNNQMVNNVQLKTGQAVSADISGYYTSAPFSIHKNRRTLGFNLKNLGSKIEYSNETGFKYPLPTSLEIGGGYHFAFGKKDYLSFYAEALKFLVPSTDDQGRLPDENVIAGLFSSFTDAPNGFSEELKEVVLSLGSEYRYNDVLTLRAGYITQSREKGNKNHISLGAGVIWNQFMFDFAYQSPISDDVVSNQNELLKFSLSYRFGRNTLPENPEIESLEDGNSID